MQYDPWSGGTFALDAPSLQVTLQLVGDRGWVARLVCRAFAAAASCRVTESSIDSVERLELVRSVAHWHRPSNMCNFAAFAGHVALLQWARSERCHWDAWTCSYAAAGGHLEVLQWMRLNSCPWNEWTCASAAKGGHLGGLQWARLNGCPWDEWTCSNAARSGHLDVLQWSRLNG